MRRRASSISASVGVRSSVAKFEHPLKYLPNRRQGIQLPPLHLVEQPLQLRVALDRALQMRLRPSRCNREDLPGEVLAPALLQSSIRFEVGAMSRDLLPEGVYVVAAQGLGEHDRWPPHA